MNRKAALLPKENPSADPTILIPVSETNLTGKESEYVNECVQSGWVSANGKYIPLFESAFADYMGVKNALTVCNGTCALHLALLGLGITKGDEVIVPSLTYIASANAVSYTGATPVFIDSERDTWNLDPTKIEAAITPKTRAIMVVHLYGQPCDLDPILAVARKHNLFVIEDTAEALGSRYRGKLVGSQGTIGVFSFFGNKTITTGEGGMVVTQDDAIAEKMRCLRGQGVSSSKRYFFEVVGYNYRMTNIQAAVGLGQIERVDYYVSRKIFNATIYNEQLRGIRGIELSVQKDYALHTHWMYSILVTNECRVNRDTLAQILKENGVETRPFFYPCHELPPHLRPGLKLPVASFLSQTGLNLPSSTRLTTEEIHTVCRIIKEATR